MGQRPVSLEPAHRLVNEAGKGVDEEPCGALMRVVCDAGGIGESTRQACYPDSADEREIVRGDGEIPVDHTTVDDLVEPTVDGALHGVPRGWLVHRAVHPGGAEVGGSEGVAEQSTQRSRPQLSRFDGVRGHVRLAEFDQVAVQSGGRQLSGREFFVGEVQER